MPRRANRRRHQRRQSVDEPQQVKRSRLFKGATPAAKDQPKLRGAPAMGCVAERGDKGGALADRGSHLAASLPHALTPTPATESVAPKGCPDRASASRDRASAKKERASAQRALCGGVRHARRSIDDNVDEPGSFVSGLEPCPENLGHEGFNCHSAAVLGCRQQLSCRIASGNMSRAARRA